MANTERQTDVEPPTMQGMIDALAITGRVLRLIDRQPGLSVMASRKVVELAEAAAHAAERFTAAALDASRHSSTLKLKP